MVIHYADKFLENGNLCNTKTKTIPTTNKKEVTCKKCIFNFTSNDLLKSYNEKNVIAQDIKGSKIYT